MMTEIAKVLEEVIHNLNTEPAEKTFRRLSKKFKFEKSAVAAVYSWIYDKLMNESFGHYYNNSENFGSFRVLSSEEITQIGLENYNYLLHFYNKGIISNSDLELIMEQIKLFGGDEVSFEQLTLLILSLFLELNNFTLPGSRAILYSSDLIN
ncbi:MAG TPA: DUF494 family protein [Ignavibacteriaceae bacterium]|nr:DUF494 family protein [Ignavibacteriaceae bacterium]